MSGLTLLLTLLGSGGLVTILSFVLDIRRQNKADRGDLITDIYKEIGRLGEELKQVKKEKQMLYSEKMALEKQNMKMQLELEDLKKDYQEMKVMNEELRRKIDILLKNHR